MSSEAPPISPIRTSKPELRVEAAAINSEPIELDATPTTPARVRARSTGAQGTQGGEELPPPSDGEKKELAKLISERKADPAVMVDIPQTPQAEELNIAGKSQ